MSSELASPDPLRERLQQLYSNLLETLAAERAALVAHDPDALADLVQRKDAVCSEISRDQQRLLADLASGQQADGLDELRALARRCQQENTLNGRIVNRVRHSNRALLRILTGEPAADLYQPPGREPPASARPSTGHRLGSA